MQRECFPPHKAAGRSRGAAASALHLPFNQPRGPCSQGLVSTALGAGLKDKPASRLNYFLLSCLAFDAPAEAAGTGTAGRHQPWAGLSPGQRGCSVSGCCSTKGLAPAGEWTRATPSGEAHEHGDVSPAPGQGPEGVPELSVAPLSELRPGQRGTEPAPPTP